jgi:hypothetical protein
MHKIQEMDGMHCPGLGQTHIIQKMAGYIVPVWVVLANNTVYQLQQLRGPRSGLEKYFWTLDMITGTGGCQSNAGFGNN